MSAHARGEGPNGPVTVSVLVPVWNNARFLREALESALAQTRPADEIIVVDDGSDDDSAAIAESLSGAVPAVRCIREPHRGVSAARNSALAAARGDFIAWLDSDDRWTVDKLAVQIDYMLAHPEVGVSFTRQRLCYEPGIERPSWALRQELDESVGAPPIGTCSLVARRALFERVGGFDVARARGEDIDWLMRALAAGESFGVVEAPLLLRRVHANNVSTMMPAPPFEVLRLLRAAIGRKRLKGAR
mgnify:CR=1 FL=1